VPDVVHASLEAAEPFPALTARFAHVPPLALTVLAVAAAVLGGWLLSALLGSESPFITFYPTILFVTLVAGWRSGLLATDASAAAAAPSVPESLSKTALSSRSTSSCGTSV
jgi:hypothetical protein